MVNQIAKKNKYYVFFGRIFSRMGCALIAECGDLAIRCVPIAIGRVFFLVLVKPVR